MALTCGRNAVDVEQSRRTVWCTGLTARPWWNHAIPWKEMRVMDGLEVGRHYGARLEEACSFLGNSSVFLVYKKCTLFGECVATCSPGAL